LVGAARWALCEVLEASCFLVLWSHFASKLRQFFFGELSSAVNRKGRMAQADPVAFPDAVFKKLKPPSVFSIFRSRVCLSFGIANGFFCQALSCNLVNSW
jgi:hypothetical protein